MIITWLKNITGYCSLEGTVFQWAGRVNAFLFFLEKRGVLQYNPLGFLLRKYPKGGMKGLIIALTGPSPEKSLQALKPTLQFESFMKSYMQGFMNLSRTQGKAYRDEEYTLCMVDRFLKSYPGSPTQLSDSIIKQWLNLFSKHKASYLYRKFIIIRKLCLYIRRFNPKCYVPESSFVKTPSLFLPYIYSRKQLTNLFQASLKLKPTLEFPLRPQMLFILLLLLYTTGIRLGEALKIRFSDVDYDNEAIYIRETKFFKSRVVPLSRSMMKELKLYIKLCKHHGLDTSARSMIFQNPYQQKACKHATVQRWFQHILRQIGFMPTSPYSNPRIHDLRHTMATHRIEDWYEKDEDVQSKLGLLSTYLGHVSIASTQRYLTMTSKLLQHASDRFKNYFIFTKT